jgi:Pyruvate/2-oxoacid:ferredoxin oxidoreductase delta subunit
MKPAALPWIIVEYCEGCTVCVRSCPKKCLEMFPADEEGIYVPWVTDVDECVGCGKCAESCVMGGIAMTVYVDEARERLATKHPLVTATGP